MDNLWSRSLDRVRQATGEHIFEAWFQESHQLGFDGETLWVGVPSSFHRDYMAGRFQAVAEQAVGSVAGRPVGVSFVAEGPDGEAPSPAPAPAELRPPQPKKPSFLNPRYTFRSFVVGPSNQFAHAACKAVAQQPARAYNPLFIYGGVGLGKTHLLHAISHQILGARPGARLYYTSAENFINDLIVSIQRDRMSEFRARYRNMDVLLIDDIQFIAGKDRTQEEFFHTFNTLYESQKQIVLSSDRVPKEIPTLEERLRSRFEWGLIADIQTPDLETKVAILHQKAAEHHIALPPDVALLLASKVRGNIRELEGCLIKISAYSSITGAEIALPMVQEILKQMAVESERSLTIEHIQKAVADYFGIKISDLKARKRTHSVMVPRQLAMFLARELTRSSLAEIGERFGGKDHSTVIHSCRKIAELNEKHPEIAAALKRIRQALETP
ncbi:MAG: chromosomal replication initiator protein DnaA [Nitrospinota bacterium]